MRKKILISLVLIIFFCSIYGIVWYIRLPEFDIYQSFATSANNFRHDDIRVIVYKNRESEEMYKRVEDEINRFAGEPNTQMTIRLYHSKKEVINGVGPYIIIFIDYENDTYEITKDKNIS